MMVSGQPTAQSGTSSRILPATARQVLGHAPFRISRIRPGLIFGRGSDPAFGPLSVIDDARLEDGAVVRMHEHRNDEILSWIISGRMIHEDTMGKRVELSPRRLMLMNSGWSFDHEERVVGEPVEMLQVFVRPRSPDMPPAVQFCDAAPADGWRLIAGPEKSNAPLTFRQEVTVFDRRDGRGDRFADFSRTHALAIRGGRRVALGYA